MRASKASRASDGVVRICGHADMTSRLIHAPYECSGKQRKDAAGTAALSVAEEAAKIDGWETWATA